MQNSDLRASRRAASHKELELVFVRANKWNERAGIKQSDALKFFPIKSW